MESLCDTNKPMLTALANSEKKGKEAYESHIKQMKDDGCALGLASFDFTSEFVKCNVLIE